MENNIFDKIRKGHIDLSEFNEGQKHFIMGILKIAYADGVAIERDRINSILFDAQNKIDDNDDES